MADSYTDYGFTKPEPGSSLNTWGSKLNVVIDMMSAQNKFAEVQISGNTSLTFVNADSTSTALPHGLKLTPNGVAAAFNLTFPAKGYTWRVYNTAGYTASISCGGANTITLLTGQIVDISYSQDDSDIIVTTPTVFPSGLDLQVGGKITNMTAGTAALHAVNKAQMEAAIAVLAGAITGGLALVSLNDTSAGYLGSKIDVSASGAITASYSIVNGGGNEIYRLTLSVGSLGVTDGGTKATGFTAASNTRYNCVFGAAGTITLPASPTAKDVIVLHLAGYYVYTLNPNSLKINTSTANLPLIGNQTVVLEYTGATDGWV